MTNLTQLTKDMASRRRFFRQFGAAMALGPAGLASKPLCAQSQAEDVDGPDWPGMRRLPFFG